MSVRCFAIGLVAGLLTTAAFAEEPKGPVHITAKGASGDTDAAAEHRAEALSDARESMVDAKRDLAEASQEITDRARDLAALEAGDFSNTLTIEDDKVVKCGNPAKYPGCVPYTDEEKAEMVAEIRRDLDEARADLEGAKMALAAAEGALASLDDR